MYIRERNRDDTDALLLEEPVDASRPTTAKMLRLSILKLAPSPAATRAKYLFSNTFFYVNTWCQYALFIR